MSLGIRVVDILCDNKVNACSIGVELPIKTYLDLVRDYLNNLDIQRGKMLVKKKDIYRRLIDDLTKGTVIPPISLALSQDREILDKISKDKLKEDKISLREIERILNDLLSPGKLNILDGLQRTYCFLEVESELKKEHEPEKLEKFYNSKIRAEIWIHIYANGLLYKILVLNTGQVKMSLRHQIEILHTPLRDEIICIAKDTYKKDITFSTYKTQEPTKGVHKYKFANVVEAFTCFSTGNPNVEKTNIVVDELNKMNILEDLDKNNFEDKNINLFVRFLLLLDEVLWKYYKEPIKDEEEKLSFTSRDDLMNSAPFLSGFFAAIGESRKLKDLEAIEYAKTYFTNLLKKDEEDPLRLKIMSKILSAEKEKAKRWGAEQRDFFYKAFDKFLTRGLNDFSNVWELAAK